MLTSKQRAKLRGLASTEDTILQVGKGGVADIEIRGLRLIDPERVKVRLSSRVGGAVDALSADEDLRRIWEMGYFSDARADLEQTPRGPVLVFTVTEKPRIDDVRVEGSDAVSMGDITEAMSSKTGDVLNDRVLADDLQKITELYRKKGYYLADVTYEVQERSGGASAVLLLRVNEGNKLYIKEVSIEGLEQEDPDDLAGKLSLKTRGLLSWITGSGVLKEEELERDSQLLQATLVNKGYIDARVAAPEVVYDPDGIRVIFRVREGDRYKLGEVGFSGDLIDTREKLLAQTKLDDLAEDGEYFNLETMQEDIKKLTDFYGDYGYAFADIGVETIPRHEDGAFVDVTYTLNPRERVYVRRVEVEGNNKTRDNVILRELRLADGQPFSGWALRRSVERLDKLRYFDEVNPQLVPTGNPGEVDLKVGVKEGNTGSINVGFGYSTYDKFGIAGGISEANLFGQGYYLGLQGYTSTKENSVRGTFINPASASIKINLVPGEEFTKLIAESGHQATITVVDISTRPAVLDEAERLGVAPGTKLCSVEKLYFADGTPAIISVDRFPTSLVKNLPTAEYLSAHPIFDFLRDEAGVAIVRDKIELESITHLRACQLAKAGAQLRCETALTFNGINYNRDNVPVMVNTEIYDTSIVKFELLRVKDVC